jgi:uroporphyrinogen decarboxylase
LDFTTLNHEKWMQYRQFSVNMSRPLESIQIGLKIRVSDEGEPVMTSRERLLAALTGTLPDRLPVTTHHVMPFYLDRCLDGISIQQFFDKFSLDAIYWTMPHKPAPGSGDYMDPLQGKISFLESPRVANDAWRIFPQDVSRDGRKFTRFCFRTPGGALTTVLEEVEYTTWVTEPLIKKKRDIDLIAAYVTTPNCDVDAVNRSAERFGDRGIVRGIIPCFDVFGQPGCWQDASCLVGTEALILAAVDDPEWVHELLTVLQRRKLAFIESLAGAHYDLLELGGGDGSASVISPRLFDEFVAPYDAPLIAAAHRVGQRIVYHLCGKIMPMLEQTLDMAPDAIETFTPVGMGGDTKFAAARACVGDRACMIGGFDQLHFFTGCDVETTRAEVRRCFEEAGPNGRFILSPSDHFFDARSDLMQAFSDEAAKCRY